MKVKIKLERPGVKRCGDYQSNKVYEVDQSEADRLVNVKGFTRVNEAPKPAKPKLSKSED